jgi:uncharacterized pyridoxal phosphate-containing UPF0001 family protein
MEITIDQTKKLSDIQTEFCKRFPYLKIEFYKQAHTAGEGSLKEKTIDSNLTINEVKIEKEIGVIKITGLMTVAELESSFSNTFGLSAQVFRKSGSIWLQKAMEKHELSQDGTVDAMDRMELE